MERYAYYVCFKCGKAYFGGEARCDLDAGAGDAFNPEELVCGGCSDVSQVRNQGPAHLTPLLSQAQMCPKHGTDYLEYKCRYCCSVAVFFCFGTTHFCNVSSPRHHMDHLASPSSYRRVTTTSSVWRTSPKLICRSAPWPPRPSPWSRRSALFTSSTQPQVYHLPTAFEVNGSS